MLWTTTLNVMNEKPTSLTSHSLVNAPAPRIDEKTRVAFHFSCLLLIQIGTEKTISPFGIAFRLLVAFHSSDF